MLFTKGKKLVKMNEKIKDEASQLSLDLLPRRT